MFLTNYYYNEYPILIEENKDFQEFINQIIELYEKQKNKYIKKTQRFIDKNPFNDELNKILNYFKTLYRQVYFYCIQIWEIVKLIILVFAKVYYSLKGAIPYLLGFFISIILDFIDIMFELTVMLFFTIIKCLIIFIKNIINFFINSILLIEFMLEEFFDFLKNFNNTSNTDRRDTNELNKDDYFFNQDHVNINKT